MREYREASRAGSIKAPRDFVVMLRRETKDPSLNCWWDPEAITYAQHPRGNPTGRGCWVIWKEIRMRQVVDDNTSFEHKVFVDVFRIDGAYDNPMYLGMWICNALNASDLTKRGNSTRAKMLDDAREKAWMDSDKDSTSFGFEFAKDRFVKGVFQRIADERGSPTTLREERVALEKKAWDRYQRNYERTVTRAKDLRLHS